MSTISILQHLRDIHRPSDITYWPLALGWYLLILGLILLIALLVYLIYQRYKKYAVLRAALTELHSLRQQSKALERSSQTMPRLSQLLRCAALARYPRREVAGLQGQRWLQFLDKTGQTDFFTHGLGQILISYPYQYPTIVTDLEPLFEHINHWLKHNLVGKPSN